MLQLSNYFYRNLLLFIYVLINKNRFKQKQLIERVDEITQYMTKFGIYSNVEDLDLNLSNLSKLKKEDNNNISKSKKTDDNDGSKFKKTSPDDWFKKTFENHESEIKLNSYKVNNFVHESSKNMTFNETRSMKVNKIFSIKDDSEINVTKKSMNQILS